MAVIIASLSECDSCRTCVCLMGAEVSGATGAVGASGSSFRLFGKMSSEVEALRLWECCGASVLMTWSVLLMVAVGHVIFVVEGWR